MTFEEFKSLHEKYSKFPVPREVYETPEYTRYEEARFENQEFDDWTFTHEMEKNGFNHSAHCCVTMAHNIYKSRDKEGEIIYDDVDIIMRKRDDGTFGIPIHDGGSSVIEIKFCPWCGSKLSNDE